MNSEPKPPSPTAETAAGTVKPGSNPPLAGEPASRLSPSPAINLQDNRLAFDDGDNDDDESLLTPEKGSLDDLQRRAAFSLDRFLAVPIAQPPIGLILVLAIALAISGLVLNWAWLGLAAALVVLVLALRVLWQDLRPVLTDLLTAQQRLTALALVGLLVAGISALRFTGAGQQLGDWYLSLNWDALGATGEIFGAVGQILIAILAVYVAWRQYIISRDLTIQQNLITQQQTIDAFFQGISELVLDAEGLLEDWPQERAIAEGRTAALLSSVDGTGKAKVLRFLSRSKLLTPLKRDRLLGRAILDGVGGYEEDRNYGVRVINLGVMLAASNMAGTDLRWTDLSDANLIRVNLRHCDLVKTNLARTILVEATLAGSDLQGARLFYGNPETASPRSRTMVPNYTTGEYTGAVIEGVDFSEVKRMSAAQRYYCCAWGGAKSRATIPGGCEGIPDRLGR